jgi:hypothetical protein
LIIIKYKLALLDVFDKNVFLLNAIRILAPLTTLFQVAGMSSNHEEIFLVPQTTSKFMSSKACEVRFKMMISIGLWIRSISSFAPALIVPTLVARAMAKYQYHQDKQLECRPS